MTNQMKQRIVGAVVIVAILAICVPIFFHETEKKWQVSSLEAKIPAEPTAPGITLGPPKPELPAQLTAVDQVSEKQQAVSSLLSGDQQAAPIAPVASVESTASANAKAPEQLSAVIVATKKTASPAVKLVAQTKAMPKTVVKSEQATAVLLDNPPQAWVVQLASFSNKDNANRLIAQLRKSGFDAYLRNNSSGNKMLIRVFVGPEINANKAKTLQKKLQNKFKLQGVVRKYEV